MRITIIANFTLKLDGEREGRFSYLADAFAQRGHEVELVTTDFYHATKQLREDPHYDKYPFKITICHEPGYKKNVSPQRLYSHYVWGKNVLKHLKESPRPDVVYAAVPSLTAAAKAAAYCHKNGIIIVTDVQDLWPEAFQMAVPNKVLQNAFFPMRWQANRSYREADLAVAVSETYVQRTLSVNRKGAKGLSVFLGNNGELFDSGVGKYKIERNGDEVILCYIGTMSESYDIPSVLDALKYIKENNLSPVPLRFVLIGGGSFEEKFKLYAAKTYPEAEFLGRKQYIEMAGLLSSCDIAINPIIKGSVASIINKVGDYALAGIPVINTQESLEYRALLDEYKCGINCRCGDFKDVAGAIVKMASDASLRRAMGKASRKLADEKFDRRKTYGKILNAVETLVEGVKD